jgi:putative methyltransferase (TIGR01177 family)
MIEIVVELSGESLPLARLEAISAAEALGGGALPSVPSELSELVEVEVPDLDAGVALAGRLALARRCLLLRAGPSVESWLTRAGADGRSAAVRRIGRPSGSRRDDAIRAAGDAFRAGGGRIDLERPDRRFWLLASSADDERLYEEIAPVDRRAMSARRMPTLPFQRPVALAPRLGRAAVNLARVRAGDRVLDPFVGTGALLAEAALLGASTVGIDRDPEMARGALRNFAHLGTVPEAIVVGDAGAVELPAPDRPFDALVCDPPYGRASGTGGEEARRVVERVVPKWAERVRSDGRIVLVLPGGYEPLGAPWRCRHSVAVRVHRSLTREFRVYERAD